MPTSPLKTPAGYVPQMAIAIANSSGDAELVNAGNPMPIQEQPFAAAPALTGTLSASGQAGPFAPRAGRAVILTLSGTWTGTARLLRSVDGGTTKLPLTAMGKPYGSFTANVCEPVWEESEAAALLYLDVSLASGALAYRMGQ
ncbi:hypothetical protein H7F51_02820 [Novosphingobium flavum]|uniref:Uncharacterized protein n=1 Tax=Novosphingobium flavum TaxID=1778672 RepID=A0A7X1FQA2_9SPHN|nr:hypothetical protein [Novosphingobium flavum]MBC2664447.1 hypothetical protein [Novosphingobium flavum]